MSDEVTNYAALTELLDDHFNRLSSRMTVEMSRVRQAVEDIEPAKAAPRRMLLESWDWEDFFWFAGITTGIIAVAVLLGLVVRWNLDVPNNRFFVEDGRRCLTTAAANPGEALWPGSGFNEVTLCEVPR